MGRRGGRCGRGGALTTASRTARWSWESCIRFESRVESVDASPSSEVVGARESVEEEAGAAAASAATVAAAADIAAAVAASVAASSSSGVSAACATAAAAAASCA